MKDSGIEWIGRIPLNWCLNKGKYFIQLLNRPVLETDEVITCFRDGEVTLRSNRREEGFTISLTEVGYQGIEVGDLVIHGMDGFAGSIGISNARGKATPVLNVLDTLENKRYMMYLMRTMAYCELFLSLSTGIRVRTCDTNWKKLRDIEYIIPPTEEQKVIAKHLDIKCSEIDTLISEIQQQIDTLEQYKRSVITETVTKGLNPDVEMKDSGVTWIGKIPKHWEVDNPKWHFIQRKDRATYGLTQLTASQKYGVVTQEEYMEITGAKVVTVEKDFDILKLVCPGDFIIHMRSFQGGLEYSEKYGSISSAYVMLIPQKTILEPRYYKWFFKSPAYIDALSSTSNLIRDGQAMRYANFIQLPILLIPEDEQRQIADYLDEKCVEIDRIISEKKQQIATIEEYKKSLIFEYVTGKKEVPSQAVIIDPRVILAGTVLSKLGANLKGKIQVQKIMYLCETILGLPLKTQYFRYPHGPYDKSIDTYLAELNSKQWFIIQDNSPMTCCKGAKFSDFENEHLTVFSEYNVEIEKIVSFIAPMKTSQAERIATLFAVWNDFIIDGVMNPSDEQIINEVVTKWTPNKANSEIKTWKGTLDKMKKNGIIPKGFGMHTQPKDI